MNCDSLFPPPPPADGKEPLNAQDGLSDLVRPISEGDLDSRDTRGSRASRFPLSKSKIHSNLPGSFVHGQAELSTESLANCISPARPDLPQIQYLSDQPGGLHSRDFKRASRTVA